MHYNRLLIAIISLFVFSPVFAQTKLSKKQLMQERIQLMQTIDSLKQLIEAQTIEATQEVEEAENCSEINYAGSEEFSGVEPGSNPDSLLTEWYNQKKVSFSDTDIMNLDSIKYTSNIPDAVYMERINKINSYIPLHFNDIIKNHIIYYTDKMPERARHILGLCEYYMPIIEEIFDYYGLPKELKAVAIIESALNPTATSRVGAKGMWQFMYNTARQYNLKITSYVDERMDVVKSCHAAAKYLRDSYTIFGDWSLAISSYNCGIGNVNKAIRRAGSREFWDIYRYLPRETRGYVPSFVAALYLMHYYKDHGIIPAQLEMPPHVDTFQIKKNLHFEQISKVVGVPIEEIKTYNTQYIENIIPGNESGYILRLPYKYTNRFIDMEDSVYRYKDSVYFNAVTKKSIKESASGNRVHVVKRGETLGHIAMKYRVSVANLKRWNNLRSNNIRIGQRLRIYGGAAPAKSSASSSSSSSSASTTKSGGYQWYTIKKNDTLSGIADKFPGVSLNDILKLNGFTTRTKIYPGKRIKIKKL